ncbi:MAG: CoA-binding protein [Candidatus Thermoplasmatota archaeon]|jgi:predicted CoA-binding protein|nr:CoA-binding protein [Candidatus Thermoplasmatota archaeon]
MAKFDEEHIPEILDRYRTVAVVGISDKPDRDSYRVAEYLKQSGYNILPVNPTLDQWLGIKAYRDLSSIPEDVRVEIVDVFRKPDAALQVVEEALKLKPAVVWLQEGVVNQEAAELAKSHGIQVVMDRCMMKEHRKYHSKA